MARRMVSRTTLTLSSVTPQEVLRSMEQVYRIWFDFYRRIGATPAMMKRAFAASLHEAPRRPYRMAEAEAFEILRSAGDLIDAWYRDAAYLDDVGMPRALPVTGASSFETLARRFLPEHAPAEVAAYFLDVGVVVRVGSGLLKPRRRTAIISQLNAMTLDRVAVQTHGLLKTLSHNYGGRGSKPPRLERQVYVTHLPVELIPEFDARAKELGALLVNQMESWIGARAMDRTRTRSTARAGLSFNAYVEPNEHARKPARRRTRKP